MTNPEVPTTSTDAREWLLERFGNTVGGAEICYYHAGSGVRHSEHWLNLQAFSELLEAYHAHKNQGLAEKAAGKIVEHLKNIAEWEAIAVEDVHVCGIAAIIAAIIERNGQ